MDKQPLPWLYNFIIFNPTLCQKEGQEDEKILFYYSDNPSLDIDSKVRQVGLCEGMINFTSRFSKNPCEALHTKSTRQVYYGPEPDHWMVLTVGIPTKGCQYVSNLTLRAILTMSYNMFTLFYSSFTKLMKKLDNLDNFREKIGKFFYSYRTALNIGESEILDHMAGVKFLPLDPNTYLCSQRFINALQDRHPPILYTALLYKEKLIYSALNKHDTQVLYHYLIKILFPIHLESTDLEVISKSLQSVGRYINGPDNFDANIKASRLHLRTDSKDGVLTEVFLLVYNNLATTVCLMIDAKQPCSKTFYKSLNSFLTTNVPTLDSIISKQAVPRSLATTSSHTSSISDNVRYLFHNYDNLAYITTVHNPPHISPVFIRLICQLTEDIHFKQEADIMVKTGLDMWVSVKKSNSRVLFSLILQKNMSIINITEEVKRLTAIIFNKAYFTE